MPIEINLLREEKGGNPDFVRESQRKRYSSVELIDEVIAVDQQWRQANFAVEQLRREAARLQDELVQKRKAKENVEELSERLKSLRGEIEAAEKVSDEVKTQVNSKLNRIGNIVHESVPVDNDEKNNAVVSTHGECLREGKELHHHELLWMIDGYEPERGAAVAGHRAYFLKGAGVLLNQALINYGLAFLMRRQYTPLQPPFFMNKEVMAETAQLEEFDEALYKLIGTREDGADEEKYLIATSEQPISAYHRGEWLQPRDLPLRYAGVSSCFRKEAGAYGRDSWGIFRVHQFEKIEQFCVTNPQNSWEMHEEMIRIAEEFYKSLGLSYRVINIVSGALNNAAAKKYDLEAWFPALGVYRELVSCSNCTDYQSRAMETRFGQKKAGDREKQYVHMLNATLCATERTICCLLENYQTPQGIVVPEVLRPFMGGMEIIPYTREKPVNRNAEKQQRAAEKKKNKAAASASEAPAADS